MKEHGKFFAVSLEHFHEACDLGLNVVCAFLVIACGTGKSNRESSWSRNAVAKYTGISRQRTTNARDVLVSSSLISLKTCSTPKHPKYLIRDSSDHELVWLPNSLITGVVDEVPPIAMLRQTGDVGTLRLLVDMYSSCNIADDGGVDSSAMFNAYKMEQLGRMRQFTIWGAKRDKVHSLQKHAIVKRHDESEVFARLKLLTSLGLVNIVPVLFDSPEGEVIHELRNPYTGESLVEQTLGASRSLLTEENDQRLFEHFDFVVPILWHVQRPVVKGIFLPSYRQDTQLTKAGFMATKHRFETAKHGYESICAVGGVGGYIKGKSKINQG